MGTFLVLLGAIGFLVCAIILIVNIIKKKSKKRISIILGACVAVFLIGIFTIPTDTSTSSDKIKNAESVSSAYENDEPTQEELDSNLKKEAVEADFIKINGGEWKNKKVFEQGKISNIDVKDPMITFSLTAKDKNGMAMYKIATFKTLPNVAKFNEGDIVKIYGTVGEAGADGIPKIDATIVSKD